jgi:hypothetical protein
VVRRSMLTMMIIERDFGLLFDWLAIEFISEEMKTLEFTSSKVVLG